MRPIWQLPPTGGPARSAPADGVDSAQLAPVFNAIVSSEVTTSRTRSLAFAIELPGSAGARPAPTGLRADLAERDLEMGSSPPRTGPSPSPIFSGVVEAHALAQTLFRRFGRSLRWERGGGWGAGGGDDQGCLISFLFGGGASGWGFCGLLAREGRGTGLKGWLEGTSRGDSGKRGRPFEVLKGLN